MKYWRKTLDQDHLKSPRYQVNVLRDRCKGCRFCIEFCPTHALRESAEFNRKGYHPVEADNEKCVNCGLCQMICPDFAISVLSLEKEKAHG
ncbi:MAG: ferredoxin family protein [Chloroflexi bacterium]|nr:ferredoxin family protein [Chloroflexota bacterium]